MRTAIKILNSDHIPWKAPAVIGNWDRYNSSFIPVVAGLDLNLALDRVVKAVSSDKLGKRVCICVNWNGQEIILQIHRIKALAALATRPKLNIETTAEFSHLGPEPISGSSIEIGHP